MEYPGSSSVHCAYRLPYEDISYSVGSNLLDLDLKRFLISWNTSKLIDISGVINHYIIGVTWKVHRSVGINIVQYENDSDRDLVLNKSRSFVDDMDYNILHITLGYLFKANENLKLNKNTVLISGHRLLLPFSYML
jgi:hypothetical protein